MNRSVGLGLIVVSGVALASLAPAQMPGPSPEAPKVAEIEKVKENLYMIKGGGGNTAAFVTAKGVVLVDTKLAGWGQPILDKVKTVTDRPVTHIINTHTHGDHVGSNVFFPPTVEIVAHENTATNMKKMKVFEDPANAHGLVDQTFKDKLTLLSGAEAIDLHYFGPGHTNGDAFVVFRALKTVHAGDIFARKGTPLLDMNNGGSGVHMGDTLAKAAAEFKNLDSIITGHSTVMAPADLLEYSEFNKAFLAAVKAAKAAGRTPEQAAAELKLPEKFAAYAMGGAAVNVAKIYEELAK
jgi:glyoxylase-like metal-dependent hydrolase (beta-lactamase superfamily II)